MATMFRKCLCKHTIYYMDDLLTSSSGFEPMIANLRELFETCREHNIKLNAAKCEFFKKSVVFLGYKISGKGIEIEPEKMAAISQLKPPNNQIQSSNLCWGMQTTSVNW